MAVVKNTFLDWLVLGFSTVIGVFAQLALKRLMSSFDLTRAIREPWNGLYLILGNAYFWAYGSAAVIGVLSWFWVVHKFDLGFAYPVAQSLGFVLIVITSAWMFSEPIPPVRWFGIALISAGLFFCR